MRCDIFIGLRVVLVALMVIMGAGIASSRSFAQTPTIPRNVEAGTLEELHKPPPAPVEGIAASESSAAIEIPEGSEKVFFVFAGLQISGMTAYASDTFDALWRPLVGQKIALSQIYQMIGEIQQRYHEDGYILTQLFLPEQQIATGHVQVQVVEGFISRIFWQQEALVDAITAPLTAKITAMRPFNSHTLEEVMLQLNALSGLRVRASLTPLDESDAEPGAAGLMLSTEHDFARYQFSVDNYASRFSGVWESNVSANLYHLFTDYDQLSAQLLSSYDPNRQFYSAVRYSLPIDSSGTQLNLKGSFSRTHPGYSLLPFDIFSYARNISIGVKQPVFTTRLSSLSTEVRFNVNQNGTDVFDATFNRDHLRTLEVSGDYSLSDEWSGGNFIRLSATRGLNILNASDTGDPLLTRAYGRSDFTKANVFASREQTLPEDWTIVASATGQISNTALLSTEQFGFGGEAFGRGYDASEISGDRGLAAALEVRQQWQVADVGLQPFAFYDIGKVWEKQPGGNMLSAASAGIGTRVQWQNVTLETALAKPLTYTPATPKLGAQNKEPRFTLQLKAAF